MGISLQNLRSRALDLLYPPRCAACERELLESEKCLPFFCCECTGILEDSRPAVCLRCGANVPVTAPDRSSCYQCTTRKTWFDATYSWGSYEGLLRDLVLQMKTDRSGKFGAVFGNLICDRYGSSLSSGEVDAVVPIPMSPWNRLLRGTNPPEAMSAVLAENLKIRHFRHLLAKRRNSLPQHGLSMSGRIRNIRGGFTLRLGYHLERSHLLLVDDVLTTGATCNEAARLLKKAGASRISVVVVARTGQS